METWTIYPLFNIHLYILRRPRGNESFYKSFFSSQSVDGPTRRFESFRLRYVFHCRKFENSTVLDISVRGETGKGKDNLIVEIEMKFFENYEFLTLKKP